MYIFCHCTTYIINHVLDWFVYIDKQNRFCKQSLCTGFILTFKCEYCSCDSFTGGLNLPQQKLQQHQQQKQQQQPQPLNMKQHIRPACNKK